MLLLYSRHQRMHRNPGHHKRNTTRGWNLPFNKLLTLYKPGPTHGTGFADDIGLLVCGPDLPTLASAMQVAINKAQR